MKATVRGPLEDPAADLRDEIALTGGMPELPDKIWFHKTAAAVIDADRCVGCGGCIAACPSRSIGVAEDGRPTLVKMCTGCSACWDYCPLAGLRVERLHRLLSGEVGDGQLEAAPTQFQRVELDTVRAAYSAASVAGSAAVQDGGVVTELLCKLLEVGYIDAAVVTKRLDGFHGEARLATTPEALRDAAGSVYHQSHPLGLLNEPLPAGVERIAFVGTPCQISVLRALQRFPWPYRRSAASSVVLAIGLFCTRSFEPSRLEQAVAEAGIDTSVVTRVDVRDGKLVVRKAQEVLLQREVKEFQMASLKGCDECADFIAASADLAVGNLASEPGRSTVIVRTGAGIKAWEIAAASPGAFDVASLEDLSPVLRTASRNRRRATRSVARALDPHGPLWTSYTEHLDSYESSDRPAKAPAAFRSHHFEVTC